MFNNQLSREHKMPWFVVFSIFRGGNGQFQAANAKSLYAKLGRNVHSELSQTGVNWFQHTFAQLLHRTTTVKYNPIAQYTLPTILGYIAQINVEISYAQIWVWAFFLMLIPIFHKYQMFN